MISHKLQWRYTLNYGFWLWFSKLHACVIFLDFFLNNFGHFQWNNQIQFKTHIFDNHPEKFLKKPIKINSVHTLHRKKKIYIYMNVFRFITKNIIPQSLNLFLWIQILKIVEGSIWYSSLYSAILSNFNENYYD